jgi:hypothetical protein
MPWKAPTAWWPRASRASNASAPSRALDAIHLASALLVRSVSADLEMAALDARIRRNAVRLGIAALRPSVSRSVTPRRSARAASPLAASPRRASAIRARNSGQSAREHRATSYGAQKPPLRLAGQAPGRGQELSLQPVDFGLVPAVVVAP